MSNFIADNFTGKYKLQKTLRFSLISQGNTQNMLDEGHIFDDDKTRRERYDATKPWLDLLHREFIEETLINFKFKDLSGYKEALGTWQKDKKNQKNQKELKKAEQQLRDEITQAFKQQAAKWSSLFAPAGVKGGNIDILFKKSVFAILEKRYGGRKDSFISDETTGKPISIFASWEGFMGAYFGKFFETRKNLYKADGTTTAIATRIVDQNLRRFCTNMQIFSQVSKKVDLCSVERDFDVRLDEIFLLSNYNHCLLQKDINIYNQVIGGIVRSNGEKIKGVNEHINKYRQDNQGDKIPFLASLNKQILSEKDQFIETIDDDNQLLNKFKVFCDSADVKITIFKNLINDFCDNADNYEIDKIYLSKEAFARNSRRWFADFEVFEKTLFDVLIANKDDYDTLRQDKNDSKLQEKDGELKLPDFIRLSHVVEALERLGAVVWNEKYADKIVGLGAKSPVGQFASIINYELSKQLDQNDSSYTEIKHAANAVLLNSSESISADNRVIIKDFADRTLNIYQFAKYFAVEKKRKWLEQYDLDNFYKNPDFGYNLFYQNAYNQIVQEYNLLRNYLTKKPYDTKKWKLNFNNSTLANGWDKNKEKDNATVILRKGNDYYLGVMQRGYYDVFADKALCAVDSAANDVYEKMEYKYFADSSRSIPKTSTQTNEVKAHFKQSDKDYILEKGSSVGKFIKPLCISKYVFELNNKLYAIDDISKCAYEWDIKDEKKNYVKSFQKKFVEHGGSKVLFKKSLTDWIDFCKEFLAVYPSCAYFDFSNLKASAEYESLDQFYKDVDYYGYQIKFKDVASDYVDGLNKDGKLFLFKIHNKDWNTLADGKAKTGTKNLHTLYWQEVFSEANAQQDFIYKLNGNAELFFRPKTSIDKLGVIKQGGKEIVKGWRYARNTILFSCPIDMNRTAEGVNDLKFNTEVREFLANNPDINIIGIDRGEKHLAYYVVIDQAGKLLKVDTLNIIGQTNGKPIDYADKLEKRSAGRDMARRDWQDIENIKDLKKGYISQVVRKLADLMIEHNAIIVFEDLNMRFKQVRGGIEKSIYQQLEKTLIDKLSFLVNKNEIDPKKAGSLLNAYQLVAPFKSFKDMGKQTGLIFYTQAEYTSKTCPQCGFRRNIKCKFENIELAKKWLAALNKFNYNAHDDAFMVEYSRQKFATTQQLKSKKIKNELFADLQIKDVFAITTKAAIRYKWFDRSSPMAKMSKAGVVNLDQVQTEGQTSKGVIKSFNITMCIKRLFDDAGIDYKNGDIKQQIANSQFEKAFYKDLLYYLFLLTEIRQSISGQSIDYIHCPSCLFNSNDGFQGHKFDSDANGAYNIARKGKLILDKISQFKNANADMSKMQWADLAIALEEWDKFTVKK